MEELLAGWTVAAIFSACGIGISAVPSLPKSNFVTFPLVFSLINPENNPDFVTIFVTN
jgi:hypothetical protein